MKRIGNLYKTIISVENLREADRKARKGKTHTYGVRVHDKNREANILALHEALLTKTFKTSPLMSSRFYGVSVFSSHCDLLRDNTSWCQFSGNIRAFPQTPLLSCLTWSLADKDVQNLSLWCLHDFWTKGKAYFPSSVLSRQNSTSRNYECSWTDMGQNIHAQYLFLCQETWYRGVRPSSWQDNKGVWGKALILPENWHQEVLSLNQSQCDEKTDTP